MDKEDSVYSSDSLCSNGWIPVSEKQANKKHKRAIKKLVKNRDYFCPMEARARQNWETTERADGWLHTFQTSCHILSGVSIGQHPASVYTVMGF